MAETIAISIQIIALCFHYTKTLQTENNALPDVLSFKIATVLRMDLEVKS